MPEHELTRFKGSENLPPGPGKKVSREISRLQELDQGSEAFFNQSEYIRELIHFPWKKSPSRKVEPSSLRKKLDQKIFGLKSEKNTLIQMINRQGPHTLEGTIPCLSGPTGTGKTALAKTLAGGLNRPFYSVNLAGLEDTAFKGRARGSQNPGMGVLTSILKDNPAACPVIMLDGLDRIPAANKSLLLADLAYIFDSLNTGMVIDAYLEMEVNVSDILLLASAFEADEIPASLKNKISIVSLPGYFDHEKQAMLSDFLIPEILNTTDIQAAQMKMGPDVPEYIIRGYTREAGVKKLNRILKDLAGFCMTGGADVTRPWIEKTLGPAPFEMDKPTQPGKWGTACSLAHSSIGGELFKVECKLMSGRGRLQVTGNLGRIMTESCKLAAVLIKERLKNFGINPPLVKNTDIAIHIPTASLPKEGPSAGLAVMVALLSCFLKKNPPDGAAFTGEITLGGNILAVGGIYQKLIAAHQNNIRLMYVPRENSSELSFIPHEITDKVKIIFVDHVNEVIKQCFLR